MLNVQRAAKIQSELDELDEAIRQEHHDGAGTYVDKLLDHRLKLEQRRQEFLRREIPNG